MKGSVSIRGDLYDKLAARCKADGIKVANLVRSLLVDIVGEMPKRVVEQDSDDPRPAGPRPQYASDFKLRKRFLIVVTPELHAKVHRIARRDGAHATAVLDTAINEMLDKLEQETNTK